MAKMSLAQEFLKLSKPEGVKGCEIIYYKPCPDCCLLVQCGVPHVCEGVKSE